MGDFTGEILLVGVSFFKLVVLSNYLLITH